MKRPITILAIADLHCEKGIPWIDALGSQLDSFVTNKPEWIPDYLVVAGDVINWTSPTDKLNNVDKYESAREGIDRLINTLNIKKDHVVIVPGNHDNTIPDDVSLSTLKDNLETFDDFCKKTGKKYQGAGELAKAFVPYFVDYIDFVKTYYQQPKNTSYSEEKYQKTFETLVGKMSLTVSMEHVDYSGTSEPEYTEDFKNKDLNSCDGLKYLSGVRAFPNDNLCFVLANTEWLYVSSGAFKNHIKQGIDIEKYIRLYEKCRLCPPFVNDAFKLINEKYKECMVITLLHRPIEDLKETGDKYVTDPTDIDPIHLILNNSQIVMSGHDHTPHLEPPTLINNRTQHIKLGSLGPKDKPSGYYTHTVSLVHIDPSKNLMELCQAKYDSTEGKWNIGSNEIKSFPLFPNCKSYESRREMNVDAPIIVAKSNQYEDVRKAIADYYCFEKLGNTGITGIVLQDSQLGEYTFSGDNNNKKFLVVVWHDYGIYQTYNGDSCRLKEQQKNIEDFKDKYRKDVLINRVIVSEVYVDYPRYSCEKIYNN